MDVNDVREELGSALAGIEGLTVFPYHAPVIHPPAVVVGWPDPLTYDSTMRRGSDSASFPVVVFVGRSDAESAAAEIGAYLNGSGARSVKAAIKAHGSPTSYDFARVASVQVGVSTVAGVDYLAATFSIDVIGSGS
jgi:hypothetical protein